MPFSIKKAKKPTQIAIENARMEIIAGEFMLL